MTAIADFQKFMKTAKKEGQSLHRSDLVMARGGGDQVAPVTQNYDIEKLELTPQLMKDLQLEQAQKFQATPNLTHNLSYGPGGSSAMGPATPNLQNRAPKPPTDNSD